jgi:hypothetical protein
MTRRHPILRATLVVAALSLPAAAPLPAQVVAGERVRVVPHGESGRVGRVVRLRGDTLWLDVPAARGARPDTTFAIPLAGVRRIDRSTGARRQVGRNARIGAAVGGALGAITGAVAGARDDMAGEAAIFIGAAFSMPGAGIGALTGLRRAEAWEPVSLPTRASTSRAPSSGGLSLAPRLRPTRVPRRDGTWTRAFAAGLTVRPR